MIEDIAKRITSVLPRYGKTYWALLTHPVAQVGPRSRDGTQVWDALLFWAISAAIFLLIRYIAFSSGADPVLFFVARGIVSLLQLLLVSLAFFWVWRLFGARYPLGSFLIATACIHGVVLPLEAVLNMGSFGLMRIIDDDLFRGAINSLNGCGQIATPATLAQPIGAHMQAEDPTQTRRLLLLYAVVTLPLFGVLFAYGVAYVRVLVQLAESTTRFGAARISLMLVLATALALLGLSFAALFDWTLFRDPALCLGTAASQPPTAG